MPGTATEGTSNVLERPCICAARGIWHQQALEVMSPCDCFVIRHVQHARGLHVHSAHFALDRDRQLEGRLQLGALNSGRARRAHLAEVLPSSFGHAGVALRGWLASQVRRRRRLRYRLSEDGRRLVGCRGTHICLLSLACGSLCLCSSLERLVLCPLIGVVPARALPVRGHPARAHCSAVCACAPKTHTVPN